MLKGAGMRKPKRVRFKVPSFSSDLFPHREFPAWKSIAGVFDIIGDSRQRQPVRSNLEDLQIPLIEASERIVVIASGGLQPHRWQRRIVSALHFLERASFAVVRYVDREALTIEEGDRILDGISETRVHLIRTLELAPIPEEIRAKLPEPPPLRVLH